MKIGSVMLEGVTYQVHTYEWPPSKPINQPLLKQEIATALGATYGNAYVGNSPNVEGGLMLTVMLLSDMPTIDSVIAAIIAAHDASGMTQGQQDEASKEADWANIRVQAQSYIDAGNNALNVIDADLATLTTVQTNITAATTLAQMKTAIAPWLNVNQSILNRQKGIIQANVWLVKALRWLIPPQ